MIEFDENFKKRFPNLAKEIEEAEWISISGVRQQTKEGEDRVNFQGYEPDVIDFLRRCSTEEEGMEIISFLEKRGEISQEYALELRIQLIKYGIRSFGSKKEWGYYK